jgi:hypothetical protein
MLSNDWYVAVEDRTVGPVSTEMLIRGIERGKVPVEAFVCPVGDSEWRTLEDVEVLRETVRRSQPPPARAFEAEPELKTLPRASDVQVRGTRDSMGSLPTLPNATGSREADSLERHSRERIASSPWSGSAGQDIAVAQPKWSQPDIAETGERVLHMPAASREGRGSFPSLLDLDITLDDAAHAAGGDASKLDLHEPFVAWLAPLENVALPPEEALLASLEGAAHATLVQHDVLWNLALCLAFGTPRVQELAARRFFDAALDHPRVERLDALVRTLESRGFMPSGIPHTAGRRALSVLWSACPEELRGTLNDAIEK